MKGGSVLSHSSVSFALSNARDGSVMPLFSDVECSARVLLRRGADGRLGLMSLESECCVSEAIEGTRPEVV